jgi:hypothetical protein
VNPFKKGEVVALAARRGPYKVDRQEGNVVHLFGGVPGREKFRAVSVTQIRAPRERAVRCRECGAPCWSILALCPRHDGDEMA